ncbi:MAG: winged helix-turn-helix domain-containing protein [Candidatus Aenigmatarchaeota archaeon]
MKKSYEGRTLEKKDLEALKKKGKRCKIYCDETERFFAMEIEGRMYAIRDMSNNPVKIQVGDEIRYDEKKGKYDLGEEDGNKYVTNEELEALLALGAELKEGPDGRGRLLLCGRAYWITGIENKGKKRVDKVFLEEDPSTIAAIADATGMSEKQVEKYVKELEKDGHVTRIQHDNI